MHRVMVAEDSTEAVLECRMRTHHSLQNTGVLFVEFCRVVKK